MVITEKKYPITLAERSKLGSEEQRFWGTFEDFIELLEVAEYPIEFHENTIIAMSIASDEHEKVVSNFIGEFHILYKKLKNYHRYGSNRHVYIETSKVAYSPDLSIVKGTPSIFEYSKGKTANTNPWLVVEVLSKSTRQKDLGQKLPNFKKIKSLQYIIFAEQDSCLVTVYSRIENSSRWKSTDYDDLEQSFQIEEHAISLADIYANIEFTKSS